MPKTDGDAPSEDQLLSGWVELRLPERRSRATLDRVAVVLERCIYITAVGGSKPVISQVTSVSVDLDEQEPLQQQASFAFTLICPSDMAATCDTKHGSVRYFRKLL